MKLPRRPRLVVDTNIWVSYLLAGSFHGLEAAVRAGRVILLVSTSSMEELRDVLDRPRLKKNFAPGLVKTFLFSLDQAGTRVAVRSVVNACRDPKDNFLLALAKDGRADLLITGDKELLDLAVFEGTRIVSPSSFLKAFKAT
jgi:putative PIN family toxin of toxin-antitoxin system